MRKKNTDQITQVWECPKCQRRYEGIIRASGVSCSNHTGRPVDMKLLSGELPVPPKQELCVRREHPPVKQGKPIKSKSRARPKVAKITTGDELLRSIGLLK